MNRSLLLIICDFLLLSLLALAKFDEPEEQQQTETVKELQQDTLADQDLIEVLRMSLEAERDDRADLTGDLEATQRELEEREKALRQREADLAQTQQKAADLEAQRKQLEEESARIAAEREQVSAQYEQTQEQLTQLEKERQELALTNTQLQQTSTLSEERLRMVQDELAKKEAALAAAEQEKQRLAEQKAQAERAQQQLSTQLEVAQAQTEVLSQSLEVARQDIEVTRQEKAQVMETTDKLAEGVSTLAKSTDTLAKSTDEIREEVKKSQPQSANTIFDRYTSNRVTVRFRTTENALIGTTTSNYAVQTGIVTDGERTFAILYAEDTPFSLDSKKGVLSIDGTFQLGGKQYNIGNVYFLTEDPRLLAVYIPQQLIDEAGLKTFKLSDEPLRFPDAVLIDNQDNGYGKVSFKLDPQDKRYLQMDGDIFTSLFGDFSPGSGDEVFSQTGDWIGLMVNGDTAMALPRLGVNAKVELGSKYDKSEYERILNAKRAQLQNMPRSLR